MKQTSTLTRKLADSQERAATVLDSRESSAVFDGLVFESLPTVFKIYTEDNHVVNLLTRYFDAATLHHVTGVYNGNVEAGLVIEILAPYSARKRVLALASDIVSAYAQFEALITWTNAQGFTQTRVYGDAVPKHVATVAKVVAK
jgi:hypothetical protein